MAEVQATHIGWGVDQPVTDVIRIEVVFDNLGFVVAVIGRKIPIVGHFTVEFQLNAGGASLRNAAGHAVDEDRHVFFIYTVQRQRGIHRRSDLPFAAHFIGRTSFRRRDVTVVIHRRRGGKGLTVVGVQRNARRQLIYHASLRQEFVAFVIQCVLRVLESVAVVLVVRLVACAQDGNPLVS
ncbi:hypothetical protein D3C80_930130 [compost metagenome]